MVNPKNKADGYYTFDSDDLDYALVKGTYSDQGCVSLQFKNKDKNHKGGDFKIPPRLIMNFFKQIGVEFDFNTDRKQSYVYNIKLKPWSEWETSLRKTNKTNKKQPVDS